jgi:hypothetical protein
MAKLAVAPFLLLFALAAPASAQPVVEDPGRCAQFYPNANCKNYGPGNPFVSYGSRQAYARHGYYPRRVHHRHRRY